MNPKPTMFIGSSSEGKHIADAIHANLERDIETTVWDKNIFLPSEGFLESLVKAVNRFDFGVFVLSRDDAAVIRKEEVSVARDNVIFEAGMFAGKLGRERVSLVVPDDGEKLRLPTDLLGTTTLFYNGLRQDDNWEAATLTACNKIKTAAKKLGGIKASRGIVAYGDNVVLMTCNGSYVQVAPTESGTLTANSRVFGEWDALEVVSAAGAVSGRSVKFGDRIGLKVLKSNQYVGANLNGQSKELTSCVSVLDSYETFIVTPTLKKRNDGDDVLYGVSFALRADNNHYIAYKPDDTQTFCATAPHIGSWERLMFVEPG
jgi:hypothetical protein